MISTAVDVLEELSETHEVPRLVLDYRQLSKLKSTYVDALPALIDSKTGRVHTTFDQTGTTTGRCPRRTRTCRTFLSARNWAAKSARLLSLSRDTRSFCGLLQIELRLLAHFSEDPLLVEAFRNGDDIHRLTASQVFGVPPMLIDAEHRPVPRP